jgi:hypothetical protein
MTFEGQRLSPLVFKIDRRDLTNRVSRGHVCIMSLVRLAV